MDQCYEGLAVPLVRAGRCRRAVQLLHQQGEDEEGGQKRVRYSFSLTSSETEFRYAVCGFNESLLGESIMNLRIKFQQFADLPVNRKW